MSEFVDDPHQLLHVLRNPDGTFTRFLEDPHTPPTPDPSLPILVLTKDMTINQSNNTWLRLFLPRKALERPSNNSKLPLIFFFHGGGFIYPSVASTIFHDFCSTMASDIGAVVASLDYRLNLEHRLPAYEDPVGHSTGSKPALMIG
ncbi:hypothetical protein QN277_012065 [Acacia crassicarpa]|uniref:Alpha/beta hydrolase fold-3 domain-containing protein n=1 Tax=Acacia crassicarpa TaxID=499986 RepID=A0AAE1MZN0_9FABA|nr:hypothetical protein QN277_012065 [Acacia crassicarpa]